MGDNVKKLKAFLIVIGIFLLWFGAGLLIAYFLDLKSQLGTFLLALFWSGVFWFIQIKIVSKISTH
jgi:hypothetical protein